VEAFAHSFREYVGTEHCVVCNSGTDALYLALRALNIGPGDEVITPSFTFIATAEVISAVGATPVFVDIDLDSFTLDCARLESALSDRTRAIMPVHLFGQPADLGSSLDLAQRYGLAVVEDCAQATGAQWQGQSVGSIGQVGCFSFYPTKNLGGCGDGGAITTNDGDLAATMTMLREHGSRVKYHHEAIGVNSRLDSVQAAILAIKLGHLEDWNQRRRQIATTYQQLLSGLEEVICPQQGAPGQGVWNQYTIRLAGATAGGGQRDQVQQLLRQAGVITAVYYPLPLHLQPVYRHLGYQPGALPASETAAHQVLSLPMFPELRADQQDRVVVELKAALAQVGLTAAVAGRVS
jgi:dTDP-4-amino-4,6-dideoxygalactose transaminase